MSHFKLFAPLEIMWLICIIMTIIWESTWWLWMLQLQSTKLKQRIFLPQNKSGLQSEQLCPSCSWCKANLIILNHWDCHNLVQNYFWILQVSFSNTSSLPLFDGYLKVRQGNTRKSSSRCKCTVITEILKKNLASKWRQPFPGFLTVK